MNIYLKKRQLKCDTSSLSNALQSLQSQGRHASTRSHTQSSADIWNIFTAFTRGFRGTKVTVFEDVEAKMVVKDRRQWQIWIQSAKINGAVFDLLESPVTPAKFYEALSLQYPAAIGATVVHQGTINGTIIAFDSSEARTKACTIWVKVGSFTFIGTPTLSVESTVYRVSLDKLPLLWPATLTPLTTDTLSRYGSIRYRLLLQSTNRTLSW